MLFEQIAMRIAVQSSGLHYQVVCDVVMLPVGNNLLTAE